MHAYPLEVSKFVAQTKTKNLATTFHTNNFFRPTLTNLLIMELSQLGINRLFCSSCSLGTNPKTCDYPRCFWSLFALPANTQNPEWCLSARGCEKHVGVGF
jgi:hypothetical protein